MSKIKLCEGREIEQLVSIVLNAKNKKLISEAERVMLEILKSY